MRRILADSFGGLENASMARDQAFDNRYARSLSAILQAAQMGQSEAAREQSAIENAQRNALTRAQLQAQSAQAADQMSFTRQNRLDQLAQQAREANDRKAYYDAMTRTTGPEAQLAKQKAELNAKVGDQTAQEEQDWTRASSLADMMTQLQKLQAQRDNIPSDAEVSGALGSPLRALSPWAKNRYAVQREKLADRLPNQFDVGGGFMYSDDRSKLPEDLKRARLLLDTKIGNLQARTAPLMKDYGDAIGDNGNGQFTPRMAFRYFKPPQALTNSVSAPEPMLAQSQPSIPVGTRARNKRTGQIATWDGQQWVSN